MPNKQPEIPIHVAKYFGSQRRAKYLFLKEEKPSWYRWYESDSETAIASDNIHEAILLARTYWKEENIQMVACGFRYTLPERDEHGENALFHQMAASYSSFNGIYFDEELGHNCFVQNASEEALNLLKEIKRSV